MPSFLVHIPASVDSGICVVVTRQSFLYYTT